MKMCKVKGARNPSDRRVWIGSLASLSVLVLHLSERGGLVSRLPAAPSLRSQFSRFVSQKVKGEGGGGDTRAEKGRETEEEETEDEKHRVCNSVEQRCTGVCVSAAFTAREKGAVIISDSLTCLVPHSLTPQKTRD